MAEGLLRHLAEDHFEAFSAGTEATQVQLLAIKAMSELGINISVQQSKTLKRYLKEPFDMVITVCDSAAEAVPFSLVRLSVSTGHFKTQRKRREVKWSVLRSIAVFVTKYVLASRTSYWYSRI